MLAVRTRSLDDARQLVNRVFGDGDCTLLITRPHADYRHRVLLRREQWTDFVADEATHIDYGNFKQAVAERQGWVLPGAQDDDDGVIDGEDVDRA